jgi:hypothetical protein
MFLKKPQRKAIAVLINEIDEYNSIIETVDPGQKEKARLTESLKRKLFEIGKRAGDIADRLKEIVDEQP